jgi:hypothetical protein
MRRIFPLVIILALALITPLAHAAQATPDYTIYAAAPALAADGETFAIEMRVSNDGIAATEPAVLSVQVFGAARTLSQTTFGPLGAGESTGATLRVPTTALPGIAPGTPVTFEIRLTSPEIDTVQRLLPFTAPAGVPTIPDTADDTTAQLLTAARYQLETALDALPFDVDLSNRFQLAGLIGAVLFVLVLLWLFTVILRLLFTSPPTYPNNPPPYANMPALHPDTLGGRRQMWQQVAQNGSMFADQIEGNLHARKLLLGTDSRHYSGWRVIGIRASQYDTYGRVARTQVIGPKKLVRQLSRTVERAESLDAKAAQRRVRPIARQLANQLGRKINRKTAGLPIALDVKFRGEHGEVSILFALYQVQMGAWQQLDSWNPEMTVMGKAIYETYTYTVFGKEDDERMGAFKRRLRDDLTHLLAELVLCTPPSNQPSPNTATSGDIPREAAPTRTSSGYSVPTTASMHPVPPADDIPDADEQANEETFSRFRQER